MCIGIFTNKILTHLFDKKLYFEDYKNRYNIYFSTERENYPKDKDEPDIVKMSLKCGYFIENTTFQQEASWNKFYVIWDSKSRKIINNEDWDEQKINNKIIALKGYEVSNKNESSISNEVKDFGLLTKFVFQGKNVVLFGAITADGTEALAKYISLEWNKIYQDLSKRKEKNIEEEDSFTIIFSLPMTNNIVDLDGIKIETGCIEKSV